MLLPSHSAAFTFTRSSNGKNTANRYSSTFNPPSLSSLPSSSQQSNLAPTLHRSSSSSLSLPTSLSSIPVLPPPLTVSTSSPSIPTAPTSVLLTHNHPLSSVPSSSSSSFFTSKNNYPVYSSSSSSLTNTSYTNNTPSYLPSNTYIPPPALSAPLTNVNLPPLSSFPSTFSTTPLTYQPSLSSYPPPPSSSKSIPLSSFSTSLPSTTKSIHQSHHTSSSASSSTSFNTSFDFTGTPPYSVPAVDSLSNTVISTPTLVPSTFRRSNDLTVATSVTIPSLSYPPSQPMSIANPSFIDLSSDIDNYETSIDLQSFFLPSSSSSSSFHNKENNAPVTVLNTGSKSTLVTPTTTFTTTPASNPWWKVTGAALVTNTSNPFTKAASAALIVKSNPINSSTTVSPSSIPTSTTIAQPTKRSAVPTSSNLSTSSTVTTTSLSSKRPPSTAVPSSSSSFTTVGQTVLANQYYSLLRPNFPPSVIKAIDETFLSASWVRTKLLPKQYWIQFPVHSSSSDSSSSSSLKRIKSDGRTSATGSASSGRSIPLHGSSSSSSSYTKEEVAIYTLQSILRQDTDIHDITTSIENFHNFEEQLMYYSSISLTFVGSPADPENLIGIVMELNHSNDSLSSPMPSSSSSSIHPVVTTSVPEYYFLPLLPDSFVAPATVVPLDQRWQLLGTILSVPNVIKYVWNLKLWLPTVYRCPSLSRLVVLRNIFDPLLAAWLLSPDTVASSGTPLPSQRFGFDYSVPDAASAYFHSSTVNTLNGTNNNNNDQDQDNEPGEPTFESLLQAYIPPSLRNAIQTTVNHTSSNITTALKQYLSFLTRLGEIMLEQLAYRGLTTVFMQQEMALVPVLVRMEIYGIACDRQLLFQYQNRMRTILNDIDRRIRSYIPGGPSVVQNFNVQSPKQLSDLLYTTLKIPPPVKKNEAYNKNAPKGGHKHISTDEATLEQLIHTHPIIELILQYRRAAKIDNTYLTSLYEIAVPYETGTSNPTNSNNYSPPVQLEKQLGIRNSSLARIHTLFRQSSTGTGRLSSAEPNLQNIPSSSSIDETTTTATNGEPSTPSTEFSLRSAFLSSGPQCILLSFDYSQIEMRVLAQVTGDPGLISIFRRSVLPSSTSSSSSSSPTTSDIYSMMAAYVFHQPITSITEAQRKQAKTCVLGLVYGIGAVETARKLDITVQEAHRLHNSFLSRFPKLATFLHHTSILFAKKYGHVVTLTGRRRLLPEINDTNNSQKSSYAARQAVNTIIQGTAADIIKQAMLAVSERMDDDSLPGRLLLQIHDELIFECPDNPVLIRRLVDQVQQIMTQEVPSRLQNIVHQWLLQPFERLRTSTLNRPPTIELSSVVPPAVPLYNTPEYLQQCYTLLGNPSSFTVPLIVSIEQGENWGNMVRFEGT